jgi:hypothetical protein
MFWLPLQKSEPPRPFRPATRMFTCAVNVACERLSTAQACNVARPVSEVDVETDGIEVRSCLSEPLLMQFGLSVCHTEACIRVSLDVNTRTELSVKGVAESGNTLLLS